MTLEEHEAAAHKWLSDSSDWRAMARANHEISAAWLSRYEDGDRSASIGNPPRFWSTRDWEQHCLEKARHHVQVVELLRRMIP